MVRPKFGWQLQRQFIPAPSHQLQCFLLSATAESSMWATSVAYMDPRIRGSPTSSTSKSWLNDRRRKATVRWHSDSQVQTARVNRLEAPGESAIPAKTVRRIVPGQGPCPNLMSRGDDSVRALVHVDHTHGPLNPTVPWLVELAVDVVHEMSCPSALPPISIEMV